MLSYTNWVRDKWSMWTGQSSSRVKAINNVGEREGGSRGRATQSQKETDYDSVRKTEKKKR